MRITTQTSPFSRIRFPSRAGDPQTQKGLKTSRRLPPLGEYFNSLYAALGPQHWWPGKTQFEVIVGAILTQNTSWTNVERALANLRDRDLLTPKAIEAASEGVVEQMIRPSGYFRQKTRALKAFCAFLGTAYDGSLERMFETGTTALRDRLLGVFGIGPETADAILLYAARRPVFVVNAYTRRILVRHGWINEKTTYDEIRQLFERGPRRNTEWFNEFHALLVTTGKQWCRTRHPVCDACPLGHHLAEGR